MAHETHNSETANGTSVGLERRVYRLEVAWFGEGELEGARADLKALRADMIAVKSMLREKRLTRWLTVIAWLAIAAKLWLPMLGAS